MTVQEQKEDPLHLFALIFFLLVSGLRKRELPKLVYHYTNVHGAFGIIDNSRLWSTGAYVMNDLREIEYGIDLLTSNIKGIRSKTRKNKRFTGFLNQLEAFIKDPAGRIERINSIFITSFCEARDALRQWRAYSGGGDGYCLAFDPSQMESLTVRQAPGNFTVDLVKVEYSPQKQNAFQTDNVYDFIDEASFTWLAWETLFSTVLTFKHPTFEDENEWRLIVRPHPILHPQHARIMGPSNNLAQFRPCFTTVNGYLKHYIELESTKGALPIKAVCLDPKIYDQNAEAVFQMLSITRGYQLEEITRSSCKLR